MWNRIRRWFGPAPFSGAAAWGLLLGVTLGGCGASPEPAAQGAQSPVDFPQSTCFWVGPYSAQSDKTNVGFPDTHASYWAAQFTLPANTKLLIKGKYTYGRYLSFVAYNSSESATDDLHDVSIVPDAGSSNPFVAGAGRLGSSRSYTVTVLPSAPPSDSSQRAANTLYANPSGSSNSLTVMYRVYVPNEGYDDTGGVGLPDIELQMADGSIQSQNQACQTIAASPDYIATTTVPLALYNLGRNAAIQRKTFPAKNPPAWYQIYNTEYFIQCIYLRICGVNLDIGANIYNNPDNAYVIAFASQDYAPVLVLHGKLPREPKTYLNDPAMGAGDMRYWSICSTEAYTQHTIACLFDEQVPVDANGNYTIVYSLNSDRPSNATSTCAVAFLPWSPDGDGAGHLQDGYLMMRNMLPSPDFPYAIQDSTQPDTAAATMGPYLPSGTYMSTAQFEALGCPVAATGT